MNVRSLRPFREAAFCLLLAGIAASSALAQIIPQPNTPPTSFFATQAVAMAPIGAPLGLSDDVEVGDVNGDGFPDIVVGNLAAGGSVSVSLNAGAVAPGGIPAFLAPVVTAVPGAGVLVDIEVADFTGDGRADVAVYRSSFPASVILLTTLPGGGFTVGAPIFLVGGAGAVTTQHLASGLINGDTIADLAIATAAGIQVLFGGGGGFVNPGIVSGFATFGLVAGSTATACAVASIAGVPTVVCTWNPPAGGPVASLGSLTGAGTAGAVGVSISLNVPTATALAVAEFNGNPQGIDVAVLGSNNIELVDGLGAAGFTAPGLFTAKPSNASTRDLDAVDVDHDGSFDLVIETAPGSPTVTVLRNPRTVLPFITAGPFALNPGAGGLLAFDASTDFDADGYADIVGGSSTLNTTSLLRDQYLAWSFTDPSCTGGILVSPPMQFGTAHVVTYDGFTALGVAYLCVNVPIAQPSGCSLVLDLYTSTVFTLNLDANGDFVFNTPFAPGSNIVPFVPASCGVQAAWQVIEPWPTGALLSNGVVNALGY